MKALHIKILSYSSPANSLIPFPTNLSFAFPSKPVVTELEIVAARGIATAAEVTLPILKLWSSLNWTSRGGVPGLGYSSKAIEMLDVEDRVPVLSRSPRVILTSSFVAVN